MDSKDFDEESPGKLVHSSTDKGPVEAFDPDPLPPKSLDGSSLLNPLAGASHALGRLQGIGPRAGSIRTLIEPFLRKEALESSQIEGTRATLSDIYTYEVGRGDMMPDENREESKEVMNYLEALNHGLSAVRSGNPISLELICEMHKILLSDVRGEETHPGEIKESQNIIGSTPYIEDARYVPPPPEKAEHQLIELLDYVNEGDEAHPLIRIGLAHYQFEAIHPFKDGNGRLGRLLISLFLEREGLLPEPYLYLSSYFNSRKREYTDLLLDVSTKGAWGDWLVFFLRGIQSQADEAHKRAEQLMDLREDYRERYSGERSGNILTLSMKLFEKPYLDIRTAAEWIDKSYDTANRLVGRLEEDGVLKELTGRQRNRFYRAEEIFEILTKPIKAA